MTETVLVRRLAARPALVFDALVTAEGIASWWGPDDRQPAISAVVDSRVNGSFRVRFRSPDGLEHECAGEFLEMDRPDRVVLSWRWVVAGEPGEEGNVSRVEFRLRGIDTGTELTLIHSGLRTPVSASSHEWGWGSALKKLLRRFPETSPML